MCNGWQTKCYLILLFLFSALAQAQYRDPTEPAHFSEQSNRKDGPAVSQYVLDEVIVSKEDKLAIINNKVVKVGDKVGDKVVKSIDINTVTLVSAEGELVIHLLGHSIKEPVK